MVRVDAPPVTVTPSPSRDRVAPWLAVAAVAMLIGAFLPWERWCGAGSFEDVERCFSARLWSGSASLLGGLAIGLLVVFLISTARLGFRAPVGIGRLSLYAGMLTAITAKLLIVAENDLITSESDSAGGPAWVGAWIGAFLAMMGIWLLATTAWNTKPRRRSIAVPVAVILAVTAGAIPYARSGLGWWGGPLADPAFLGGGNAASFLLPLGQPTLFDGLLYVHNVGHVAATMDGLDLVDPLGRIRVHGTYVIRSGDCTRDAITLPVRSLNGCVYALDGYRIEPGSRSDSVMIAMLFDVPHPGVYRSGWFRIRYHVGPLRYEIFRTDQRVVCAPEPGKQGCPGDGL